MLTGPWLTQLQTRLWDDDTALPTVQRWLQHAGRFAFSLGRDLFEGQLSMRAMGLVYTTLLSLVPLLALSFSVLKGLGVQNQLEPTLAEMLRPLGPQGAEITEKVIGFVEKTNVGVLGSAGVALLFYTAISMIQKVESSFNFVWRIERVRPLGQRIGEYLSILMVGPAVVFSALGMTGVILNSSVVASLEQVEPLGSMIAGLGKLIPYFMIIGMFTFLYVFVPNTKVAIRAAAIGGLAAGALWQTASLGFAWFVANSTNYNAIYSSFAVVILLLIWLYLGWLILLIGCQLAYYAQNPAQMRPKRKIPFPAGRQTEYLALMIMGLCGRHFINGEPGPSETELTERLSSEPEYLTRVLENLISRGLLAETGQTEVRLVPGRDLASMTIGEFWRSVREEHERLDARESLGRQAVALLDAAEENFLAEAGGLSLREWILEADPPSAGSTETGASA